VSSSANENGFASRDQLLGQIEQHLRRGDFLAAEREVLDRDLSRINEPIRLFNRILIAYADSHQYSKLENLFLKLSENPELPQPDAVSHNVCLKGLSPDRAKQMLEEMTRQGIAETISFNTVITSFCGQGRIKEAVGVLESLVKCSEEQPDVKPDILSFSPIVQALGKSGRPKDAELLVERMRARGYVPDVITWTSVLHAWSISNQPEAPDRAITLLNEVLKEQKPDTALYNAVLLALANDLNRGKEAEEVLRQMSTPPNIITYSTCMLAWKNSPDLPQAVFQAEALLEEVYQRGLTPNVVLFSTLIALYARCGMVASAERILQRMEQPNVVSYTAVLEAWANSERLDAVDQAIQLLNEMDAKPNATTFNTVLKVIEKCPGHPKKSEGAVRILSRMREAGCRPNIRTFNAIFSVCAHDLAKQEALKHVLDNFYEMKSLGMEVDNYTYPSLFKALANLDASFETVEKVFAICCQDGAVDRMVTGHLKRFCTEDELKSLLPVKNVSDFDMTELPEEWRSRRRRRRKRSFLER
jgi:pentatricopeptide repeat protein